MISIKSFKYFPDIFCPAKYISGAFLFSLFKELKKLWLRHSITALAPKYEPPIPITTKTSESVFILSLAFFILENSSLS